MSKESYIFEVNENNFEQLVVRNSEKLPVLVAFIGVWSEPCFITTELFSRLAREFSQQFIFAKVDIDEQPELRKKFHIENVPTMLVFQHGKLLSTELGQINEEDARDLLARLDILHESDELRIRARQAHLQGDTTNAVMLLTQAIQAHPSNYRVAMDMVQIFLDIKDIDNARNLFSRLPEQARVSDMGKNLSGQLSFLELAAKTTGKESLLQELAISPENHQIRFDLAVCLVAERDYKSAMDNLLEIVKNNPEFSEGAARELLITLIRMLGSSEPELAQDYQRQLSNLLAK